MNDVFLFAAHNTVVAFLFALFVYGLTRVWRNPPVAHVLWLLVLLKLVAPPVLPIGWSPLPRLDSVLGPDQSFTDAPRMEGQGAEGRAGLANRSTARATGHASVSSVKNRDRAAIVRAIWSGARPVLLWIWLGGAGLCAMVATIRIVRFERLLRDTLPASERLQRLACDVAGKLGVRRMPALRYVDGAEVPMLWWAGHPTIVLPMPLVRQLDDEQTAMVLAHELAHLRRRDHWVRAAELIVSTVYWWNPLVWVIRRQIHQAEDLCCDAWVRWAFPDRTKHYAEVVVKTAESLSASQVGARLLPASYFLHSMSLKARIEMILRSKFAPRVSTKSMLFIGLVACVLLPAWMRTSSTQAWAGAGKRWRGAVDEPETLATSEFPFVVQFEQGATRFEPGDEITIEEVRGTAETFVPGNIYWIKGTYKLASHDSAGLSAYTTAMEAKDAISTPFKVQSVRVDRGSGTFTLFLPMSCRGWPHISFYPIERGESFSGNYFGTGDSVLRRWWGEKAED